MKRIAAFLTVLLLGVSFAQAQSRVPSTMVKFDSTGFVYLTNMTTLQEALVALDTMPGTAISYAPRSSTTNVPITYVTPRWIGDIEIIYGTSGTNVQVWQSYGVTTNSWRMVYPPVGRSSYDATATNVAPSVEGETLQINGATNILWRAFGDGSSNLTWKAVYRGAP